LIREKVPVPGNLGADRRFCLYRILEADARSIRSGGVFIVKGGLSADADLGSLQGTVVRETGVSHETE
jgi:hypothetical protein